MKHIWMKFYPSDWRGDAGLRQCSFGARGLWMDLISVMHEATPYGHLLVNGKPPNARKIAAMFGGTEKQVSGFLVELEEAGVYSWSDDSVIFCRRMVRDAKKAADDYKNGKAGGNPNLAKKSSSSDNPEDNGGDNPPDKAQILDTREEERKKDSEATLLTASAVTWPDVRTELWNDGLTILRGLTGKGEGPMRALLGKLLKAAYDDCDMVLAKLREAASLRPVEPVAWITAAVSADGNEEAKILRAAGLNPDGTLIADRTIDGDHNHIHAQPRLIQ